ncbi:hypothetical protein [Rhodococcus sp. ACPA1]|uniref:hypothetical protein n=1 Tax=Rhodococcus sp. ACPA1 TaxID=2028572 RepID=UPI00211CF817|nr:hypothetical protein [Rhodococcus sp. ACPA1]
MRASPGIGQTKATKLIARKRPPAVSDLRFRWSVRSWAPSEHIWIRSERYFAPTRARCTVSCCH